MSVARSPGGIILGREQGELAADFTALGNNLATPHQARAASCCSVLEPYLEHLFLRSLHVSIPKELVGIMDFINNILGNKPQTPLNPDTDSGVHPPLAACLNTS
jgi:hypothetical protein